MRNGKRYDTRYIIFQQKTRKKWKNRGKNTKKQEKMEKNGKTGEKTLKKQEKNRKKTLKNRKKTGKKHILSNPLSSIQDSRS